MIQCAILLLSLINICYSYKFFFFFFNDTATTEIYTLSLHDALPISRSQFNADMQPVLAQMAPLPAGCTSIPAPTSCAVPGTTDTTNPAGGADLVFDPAALPTTLREDSGSARIDYNFSDKDRIFFRYNIDDSLTN